MLQAIYEKQLTPRTSEHNYLRYNSDKEDSTIELIKRTLGMGFSTDNTKWTFAHVYLNILLLRMQFTMIQYAYVLNTYN